MKFSAFAVAVLAGVASATSLRVKSVSSETGDARVIIKGIEHELTEKEMKIISESAVTAYNKAYKKPTGYSLIEFKPQINVDFVAWMEGPCRLCPDDDDPSSQEDFAVSAEKKQGQIIFAQIGVGELTGPCRLCPDDDDPSYQEGQADLIQLGTAHEHFQNTFCSMLRSSGSANLANAHDCSFDFLETMGHNSDRIPAQATCNKNKMVEAQVMMKGTLQDFSEVDLQLINESAKDAYNNAFLFAGLSVGDFEAKGTLDVPVGKLSGPCRLCPDDDDPNPSYELTEIGDAKLVLAQMNVSCVEDEYGAAKENNAKLAFMHKAFEKAFCSKLQNSGVANFANVEDCTISMVTSPAAGAEIAQK